MTHVKNTLSFLRTHRITITTLITALIIIAITATSAVAAYNYAPKDFSLTSTCEKKMNRYNTMLDEYHSLLDSAEKDYQHYNDEDIIAAIDERNKPRYTQALASLRKRLDHPLNIVVPPCKPDMKFKYIENRRSTIGREKARITTYLTTIHTIGDHNQLIALCRALDELETTIAQKSEEFSRQREGINPLIENVLNQGIIDPDTIEKNKPVIDYAPPTQESLQIPEDCMDETITHDNTSDKNASAIEFRMYKRDQLHSIIDTLDKNIAQLEEISRDYGAKLNDFEAKKAEQDAKLLTLTSTTPTSSSEVPSDIESTPEETIQETLEPSENNTTTITETTELNIDEAINELYETLNGNPM